MKYFLQDEREAHKLQEVNKWSQKVTRAFKQKLRRFLRVPTKGINQNEQLLGVEALTAKLQKDMLVLGEMRASCPESSTVAVFQSHHPCWDELFGDAIAFALLLILLSNLSPVFLLVTPTITTECTGSPNWTLI